MLYLDHDIDVPGIEEISVPFMNDGGPLIILTRELVANWRGIQPDINGENRATPMDDLMPEFAGTDYAIACSASGWVDVITVRNGKAIAIGAGDQANDVQWLRLQGVAGVMLVMPVGCEPHFLTLLMPQLQRSLPDDWEHKYDGLHVDSGDLVLIHASDTGSDVSDASDNTYASIGMSLPIHIESGVCDVLERTIMLSDESTVVICRFAPTVIV